jgi:hypothetical protein
MGRFLATSSSVIYEDCRIMASGFDKIAFEFCPREANVVAHELAKFSVNSNSSFNWCDD